MIDHVGSPDGQGRPTEPNESRADRPGLVRVSAKRRRGLPAPSSALLVPCTQAIPPRQRFPPSQLAGLRLLGALEGPRDPTQMRGIGRTEQTDLQPSIAGP